MLSTHQKPMKLSLNIRATTQPRRLRLVRGGAFESVPEQPTSQRHPSMAGLKISPVHGHHCICRRCETGSRPDAA